MARARGWSLARMIKITTICGAGHVAGSVVLGVVGLALGLLVVQMEEIESARGDTAAWLLIAFGLTYLVWGLARAVRNAPHAHHHVHADGTVHCHEHVHDVEHIHVHESVSCSAPADRVVGGQSSRPRRRMGLVDLIVGQVCNLSERQVRETGILNLGKADRLPTSPTPHRATTSMTAWVLFIVFVLGPCEPLIPLLIWPGAKMSLFAAAVVVLAYAVTTVLTMCCCALALFQTAGSLPHLGLDLHRYAHALAGSAVLICGLLIKSGL